MPMSISDNWLTKLIFIRKGHFVQTSPNGKKTGGNCECSQFSEIWANDMELWNKFVYLQKPPWRNQLKINFEPNIFFTFTFIDLIDMSLLPWFSLAQYSEKLCLSMTCEWEWDIVLVSHWQNQNSRTTERSGTMDTMLQVKYSKNWGPPAKKYM